MSEINIYGAYGYTGRLIVKECLDRGLKPKLAGRNPEKMKVFAESVDLPYEGFDINDQEALEAWLQPAKVVIHCGGPFIHTAEQMIKACLATKTHYLDITGEYQVFDLAQSYDQQAKEAGIMLLPGAGFDVVPSDCLAAMLKNELPNGDQLELAFVGKGAKLSRGTTKTMIENLGEKLAYRKDGEYAYANMGEMSRSVDFGAIEQTCMAISWGDVSSAYFSTGIPNIKVFAGTSPKQIAQVRRMNKFSWFFKLGFVKNFLLKKVDKKSDGPSDEKREKATMHLWGQITDGASKKELRLKAPNGYTLTADASVTIAQKVIEGNLKEGYQTPSTAYGKDLILEMKGCEMVG